jgi:uncharacterized protein
MQRAGDFIHLSAGDLVGHLNCRYLTALDLKVAKGELDKPKMWDPVLETLAERGNLHEQGFVDHLKEAGLSITIIDGVGVNGQSVADTLKAMKRGDPVIVQAALQSGPWGGRADVLRRVEIPSPLGDWSYQVIDTKLARKTKGNTVLQISLYTDLLSTMQGSTPTSAFVVTPGTNFEPEEYRTADYAAYYRHVRKGLEQAIAAGASATYPEPIEHCEICRWRSQCDERRRGDDHLSLVAGISKVQRRELEGRGVQTMAALAELPLPLAWRPDRGAAQSYERIREQARIQVEGRTKRTVIYETLPQLPKFGLARLPEPSAGDIFFDFEGDPFVGDGGLEFLFGYLYQDDDGKRRYVGDWASTRQEERAAFERFVDFVIDRIRTHPGLHIYHFAPYEPAAIKRLMGRYASRENEVDDLLRAERFVDLYAVVRHAIRASVESYSIKKLEPLYQFTRSVPLDDVRVVLARTQARLELTDADSIPDADKTVIRGYNQDDCVSTEGLRDWLEARRTELIAKGTVIERPTVVEPEDRPDRDAWQERVADLARRLTEGVPDDIAERRPEQQARWLLASMLDWHGREKKAVWWEYFRLRDLSVDDLLHERDGLAGLEFVARVGGTDKAPVHRYRFALQDTDIRPDDDLRYLGGEKFGRVTDIALDQRTIDIKKRGDTAELHPEAIFAHSFVETQVLAEALMRIGDYVAEHGIEGEGDYQAARDLLLAAAPRLRGQAFLLTDEAVKDAALRIALHLNESVVPVQGPPGAGKTYTGARMIGALAKQGKTVGVTANSHTVIGKLLDETVAAARKDGRPIPCMQKVSDKQDDRTGVKLTTGNSEFLGALRGPCELGGATAWFWARPDALQSVDVLFIDEAAQMSLANVLAVSQAARSLVLLGDPRQLEQPMQGSHPDGVDVSALDHLLAGSATVSPERGLFLPETWRLHPAICAFNSELFYEGRLRSLPGLKKQEIKSVGMLNGAGLRYSLVEHNGNQSSSPEEVDCVCALVDDLINSKSRWLDRDGVETALELKDILIIAPYNAQVFALQERLPTARIGTVDKFQGQEAPVVIYSMTTSSYADAPRGMEFLYSANRLNVAVSRAKCLCVVVAAPALFEPECRTPRQMQLANAFSRYLEMASPVVEVKASRNERVN